MSEVDFGTSALLVHNVSALFGVWECVSEDRTVCSLADGPNKHKIGEIDKVPDVKIPAEEMKKVIGTICAYPHKETSYLIHWSPIRREWRISCPHQVGEPGFYTADRSDDTLRKQGFFQLGTIHSHPGMNAFWSEADLRDRRGMPGLHMVFGTAGSVHVLMTYFTALGQYDLHWESVCEPLDINQHFEPCKEYQDIINQQKRTALIAEHQQLYRGWTRYATGPTSEEPVVKRKAKAKAKAKEPADKEDHTEESHSIFEEFCCRASKALSKLGADVLQDMYRSAGSAVHWMNAAMRAKAGADEDRREIEALAARIASDEQFRDRLRFELANCDVLLCEDKELEATIDTRIEDAMWDVAVELQNEELEDA